MVTSTHRHTLLIENHTDIVVVAPLDIERDDRCLTFGSAIDAHTLNLEQLVGCIAQYLLFVMSNLIGREALQKLYRLGQSQCTNKV